MDIIFILLPLSLLLGLIFFAGYCWSARNGQFEDLDTPGARMLPDEEGVQDFNGGSRGQK